MTTSFFFIGTDFKKSRLRDLGKIQWQKPEQIDDFFATIKVELGIDECFFLKTCNRREFYFYAPHLQVDPESFASHFLDALSHSLRTPLQAEDFHYLRDRKAAHHLFSVTSSLKSMVIGETNIISQIKSQFAEACTQGHSGRRLRALIDTALKTSKQVRTQTAITKNVVSMSSLILRKGMCHLHQTGGKRVVFVGAGPFVSELVTLFNKRPDLELVFVNRTLPTELANRFGGRAISLKDFMNEPLEFDVLVSATGSPSQLFDAAWMEQHHGSRQCLIVDGALPRDIDPACAELPGFAYIDLEKLEATLRENRALRQAEIPRARPFFEAGLVQLEQLWLEMDLAGYHKGISQHYRQTADKAVAYLIKDQLGDVTPEFQQNLIQWARHLAGNLVSVPILGLKGVAGDMGQTAVNAYVKSVQSGSNLFQEHHISP